MTLRDFSTVFDSYSEFSESYIGSLMELVQTADEDVSEEEQELDARMADFEALMDRRPFLVNEVLLRRNPDDVQEWEKRVVLWGNDADKVSSRTALASWLDRAHMHCVLVSLHHRSTTLTVWPRKRSAREKRQARCISSSFPGPSSTSNRPKAWSLMFNQREASSKRLSLFPSSASTTWQRSGSLGRRWKCASTTTTRRNK